MFENSERDANGNWLPVVSARTTEVIAMELYGAYRQAGWATWRELGQSEQERWRNVAAHACTEGMT